MATYQPDSLNNPYHHDELAVDDGNRVGIALSASARAGETFGPCVEANCAAFLDGLEPVAVELGLVQPAQAARWSLGDRGKAMGNEAERR